MGYGSPCADAAIPRNHYMDDKNLALKKFFRYCGIAQILVIVFMTLLQITASGVINPFLWEAQVYQYFAIGILIATFACVMVALMPNNPGPG